MARRDALLLISKNLIAKRNLLRKRLGEEMDQLGVDNFSSSGDAADVAFGASGYEVASRLAEIEARELALIEVALHRILQGKYGVCNGCDGRIPVGRLNALPYSVLCMTCQREFEKDSTWLEDRMVDDWNKVREAAPEREITLADIEADLR